MTAFQARMAGRLAIDFMLDLTEAGRPAPLMDSLLLNAILHANVMPVLRDPALQAAYARIDTPPPDSLRRPTSINGLAESLSLPFETVRRRVRALAARGLCAVSPQGVHVPSVVVSSPQFLAIQQVRYARVMRFHGDLRAYDAVAPLPFTPLPADHPQAPIRGVGRILADYFFRTLGSLLAELGDPLSVLIVLEVLRSSLEHIPLAQLENVLRSGSGTLPPLAAVRVAAVARRLRAPYETTRRHVGWLVEAGAFRREGRGVVPARLGGPGDLRRAQENLSNLRRMFRAIAALDAGAGPAEASR